LKPKDKSKMLVYKSENIILIIICISILACNVNSNSKLPDISNIEKIVEIKNFEKALFQTNVKGQPFSQERLLNDFPAFYPFYANELMQWDSQDTTKWKNALLEFTKNQDIQSLYDSVSVKFNNLETINKELVTAFKYFQYYFPDHKIPDVVYFISGFRQMALTLDNDVLGIGLDMHMGKDFKYYNATGYPKYSINQFTKEHLSSHAMEVWAQQIHPEPLPVSRFIDEMIYRGKMLYFLDLVLPSVSDHLKIGYETDQLDWCKNNEKEIWEFFVEKKILFENTSAKFKYYINDGPHSNGMPKKAPGKIGRWVGWQIVRKFMDQNPDVSVQELFEISDGAKILKKSKYKP